MMSIPDKCQARRIMSAFHLKPLSKSASFYVIYQEFTVKNSTIGTAVSKFASLRPKWCVAIGTSGTHSVYVCSIYQNATLLCSASGLKITYKYLINMIVCDSKKQTRYDTPLPWMSRERKLQKLSCGKHLRAWGKWHWI